MTYYRVKANFDQAPRSDGSILVKDELYTEKELKDYRISIFTVERVDVAEVYWFFGARFACEEEHGRKAVRLTTI